MSVLPLLLVALVAVGCTPDSPQQEESPSPATVAPSPVEPPPTTGETAPPSVPALANTKANVDPSAVEARALLGSVHRCIEELTPDMKGVSGNPLRLDSLKLSPHQTRFVKEGPVYEIPDTESRLWHIRIEEEHPHRSIPNGMEYYLDVETGRCSHAPME